MDFKFLLACGLFCAVGAIDVSPADATTLALIGEASKRLLPYIEKANKTQ
jgi:hypothetical protein